MIQNTAAICYKDNEEEYQIVRAVRDRKLSESDSSTPTTKNPGTTNLASLMIIIVWVSVLQSLVVIGVL